MVSQGLLHSVESSQEAPWLKALHDKMGHTPLAECITLWHAALMENREQGLAWLEGLMSAAAKSQGIIKVGTMNFFV